MATNLVPRAPDPPGARCPVCCDPIGSATPWVCPSCETPQHRECHQYLGGCARFACSEAATPRKRVAEVLGLITSDLVIERAGRTATFCLLCVVFYPLLPILAMVVLYEIAMTVSLARLRARLSGPMPQDELVGHLREIARKRPLLLFQGGREPPRPGLLATILTSSAAAMGIAAAIVVLAHFFLRPVSREQLDGFFFTAEWLALLYVAMFYPPRWLAWKQLSYLKQAGRIFFHWREELQPLVFGEQRAKWLLAGGPDKKPAKGQ